MSETQTAILEEPNDGAVSQFKTKDVELQPIIEETKEAGDKIQNPAVAGLTAVLKQLRYSHGELLQLNTHTNNESRNNVEFEQAISQVSSLQLEFNWKVTFMVPSVQSERNMAKVLFRQNEIGPSSICCPPCDWPKSSRLASRTP